MSAASFTSYLPNGTDDIDTMPLDCTTPALACDWHVSICASSIGGNSKNADMLQVQKGVRLTLQTSASSAASAGSSEKAHALGFSGHFPVKALAWSERE
jgi:hypothetical protein